MTTTRRMVPRRRPTTLADHLTLSSVATAGKYTGAAGVVVYAVLFLGYRAYYDRLGLNPEDVGVTNTFVLVRSMGFIVLFLVAAALVAALLYVPTTFEQKRRVTATDLARIAAIMGVTSCLVFYFYRLISSGHSPGATPVVLFVVLFVLAMSSYLLHEKVSRRTWLATMSAVWVVLAAVMPAVAIIAQSDARAEQAVHCTPVEAFTVGSIPVVDVSALDAVVYWVAATPAPPAFPRPPAVAGLDGTLLGQTGSTVVFCARSPDGDRVLRLSSAQVAVTVRFDR